MLGGIDRQKACDHRRHDRLRGTRGAVVAFDRDAEPLLRQRGAIDAFGAGFHKNAAAEELHDLGAEPLGAGDEPGFRGACLSQPRRRSGA